MKTELACLPCFFGQITRTLGHAGVNGDRGRRILRRAGALIEDASFDQAPARITTLIHRLMREETGVDPYKQVKDAFNRIALEQLPRLRRLAEGTPSSFGAGTDRLEGGVRAAIAGNVIDFGIYDRIDLDRSIQESFHLPLTRPDYDAFAQAVRESRNILYLCDNAGEIAFDRVLIDVLRGLGKNVTAVVKGIPVINDATREDAAAVRLAESATHVIDNGNDGIGTLLEHCSDAFKKAYDSADMIISKGQANYETLHDVPDKPLFFLFKVKCPVVAQDIGRVNGDIILMANRRIMKR